MSDILFTMEDGSQALMHYGKLGMKWGVRNAETLRKYAGGKEERRQQKQEAKAIAGEYQRIRRVYGGDRAGTYAINALGSHSNSSAVDKGLKIAGRREKVRKGVGLGLMSGGMAATMASPITAAAGVGLIALGSAVYRDTIRTAAERHKDNKRVREIAVKSTGPNERYSVKQHFLTKPGTYYVDEKGKKIRGSENSKDY